MASNWNHRYGHKEILRRYVGRATAPPIAGYLQHGWADWRPYLPRPFVGENFQGFVPKLVWAERDREMCEQNGLWPVRVVGAPFLYLLEISEEIEPPKDGTLVAFPMHAVAGAAEVRDDGWARYADNLESMSEYRRITVCLHPNDYAIDSCRQVFTERGMETACNGEIDDPAFAWRMLALLGRHAAVTSNSVGTALFYAAVLGRRTFLHGEAMTMRLIDRGGAEIEGARFSDADRLEYPALVAGLEGEAAREFARPHLGPERLLAPAELERVLGWRGPGRAAGGALALAASVRRRLKSAA